MGHSRSIVGSSQRAYRVKKVTEYEGRDPIVKFFGPYSTLGAAKGKRTTEVGYAYRWESAGQTTITVEQTPEGWEKVEV